MNCGDGFDEVGWRRSGGSQGLAAGLARDRSVAASGAYEFLDTSAGLVFDPVRYSHGGQHYASLGLTVSGSPTWWQCSVDVAVGLTGACPSTTRSLLRTCSSMPRVRRADPGGTGGGSPDPESELRAAGARAHNRFLKDFCSEAPGRLLGVPLIYPWPDWDAGVAVWFGLGRRVSARSSRR